MIGLLCNQTVSLKTDSKTLNYSVRKLKYSPSILKHNKNVWHSVLPAWRLDQETRRRLILQQTRFTR